MLRLLSLGMWPTLISTTWPHVAPAILCWRKSHPPAAIACPVDSEMFTTCLLSNYLFIYLFFLVILDFQYMFNSLGNIKDPIIWSFIIKAAHVRWNIIKYQNILFGEIAQFEYQDRHYYCSPVFLNPLSFLDSWRIVCPGPLKSGIVKCFLLGTKCEQSDVCHL